MTSLVLLLLILSTLIQVSSSSTLSLSSDAFLGAKNSRPVRETLRTTKMNVRYLSDKHDTDDDDSSESSSKSKASSNGDDEIKVSKPLVHKTVPSMKTTDDDNNSTFTPPPEVEPPFWKEAVSALFLFGAMVLCIATAVKARCNATGYREIPSTTLVV